VIDPAALETMREHARSAAPEEACGLLVGRAGRIVRAVPAANVSPQPRVSFDIHARDLLELEDALGEGEEVVGLYHSHPGGPAIPSSTDLQAMADWPGWVFVIVPGDGGPPRLVGPDGPHTPDWRPSR